MKLSRQVIPDLKPSVNVVFPDESIFDLPEKILQFGTGVLLRGLCDDFVDRANRQGVFNGRIVVVKSTDKGDASAFAEQDGLYTIVMQGIDNEKAVEEFTVNASISRTLSARSQWVEILACASNPDMQIVISNTTEVGIQLLENDKITSTPPTSYPGKLIAFLHERFNRFNGSPESGMVIIPTELLVGNGNKLKSICLTLAELNGLSAAFITWLNQYNYFCNSLVDRIVPGKPDAEPLDQLYDRLGYQDDLLAVAEVYRLWAIEGDDHVRQVLSFHQIDAGVIIEPDIEIYRELKLRMLNGTHTLTCGLAYLYGMNLVRESMNNPALSTYVEHLMLNELGPAIPYEVAPSHAEAFGRSVLSRFSNPFLQHKLLDITVQYSAKMRMRNVPLLLKYYERFGQAPTLLSLGFAAYLLFMKAVKEENGKYFGERNGQSYLIQDDQVQYFYQLWSNHQADLSGVVKEVLQNENLWGTDLSQLVGFEEKVSTFLHKLVAQGMVATLNTLISQEKETE